MLLGHFNLGNDKYMFSLFSWEEYGKLAMHMRASGGFPCPHVHACAVYKEA